MARRKNYAFERKQRAEAKAAKREAKRQAKALARAERARAASDDAPAEHGSQAADSESRDESERGS